MTTSETRTLLRKLIDKANQEPGLTDDEEAEFERLHNLAETEGTRTMWPLACCEAAQKYPAVQISVDVYNGDSRNAEARWALRLDTRYLTLGVKDFPIPSPIVCPYCGTPLPKLVRKVPFPEDTCVVTDGGYYCDVCKERLHGCTCLPPANAWKIEGNDG